MIREHLDSNQTIDSHDSEDIQDPGMLDEIYQTINQRKILDEKTVYIQGLPEKYSNEKVNII